MKKSLLITLGLVAAAAPAAMAEFEEPAVYPGASFQHISPNGRYAVSEIYGFVTIYDLQEGIQHDFGPSQENGFIDYSGGLGNSVSNTGIVLGNVSTTTNACYFEDGEWKELSNKGANPDAVSNLASGITPDGARICGSIGLAPMTTDDVTMINPVYWDRLPDGTYGDPVPLPAPTTDLFGRVPQYITANAISDDGKVIAGQITDYSGQLQYPIVYIQDAEGKWSYKMLAADKFNPEKVELPVVPESPVPPVAEDYMTADQLAAYKEAVAEYEKTYDPALRPEPTDYMSEEQRAKYEQDNADYKVAFEEWEVLSDAFYAAWDKIMETSPIFVFNSVFLTPDGKKYITSSEVLAENFWDPSTYSVTSIDIATGEMLVYGGTAEVSLNATHVPNNDVIFGWNSEYDGYIIKDGQVTNMADYFATFSPELDNWVKENMTHTVEGFDWDTFETYEVEVLAIGMPIASEDLSVIATWTSVAWDNTLMAEGYIFKMSQYTTGVDEALADAEGSISVDACGNIIVKGDVAALEVYNLSGVQVLSVAQPEGVVATDFARGVYVARAILADGRVVKAKLVK